MKHWTIPESKTLAQVDVECTPGGGELKVKVTDVVLSHSDACLWAGKDKGKLPVVPGRIAVGLVSEMGEDARFMKGERVLLSPYRDGKIRGVDITGYLGDYVLTTKDCVLSLPEGITSRTALFAEATAMALRAVDKLKVEEGEYVLIYGADNLGLLVAQIVDYYHAIPIVVANTEEGLDLATELGVTYVIDRRRQNVEQRVRNITNGAMCECAVLPCEGSKIQVGLGLTRRLGRVCIIGPDDYVGEMNVDLKMLVAKRLTVSVVSNGGKNIPGAINLLATNAVHTATLPYIEVIESDIESVLQDFKPNQPFGTLTVCKMN